ncbi:MAG TPA: MXAN_6640 family putative metalloprotease [Gaiellales bacterium]
MPPAAAGAAHRVAGHTAAPATLDRARALLAPHHAARARDGTMVLRDLALHLRELGPADRRAAVRLLARPSTASAPDRNGWTAGEAVASPDCGPDICVHWAAGGADAPPATDTSPADGIPDWVAQTLQTAEEVWNAEVDSMGYRAPLHDTTSTNNGGDGRLDIYLDDLAPAGLYGACTSDDPKLATLGQAGVGWDVSAYCEVDDDYADAIFSNHTPLQNLEVTLAHEFFHAVQFAYDFGEDTWLMEATAAWMEDEVYDAVNDNRQYLRTSALSAPWLPLDRTKGCCYQYGAWIWFRYLSESMGPSVVRDIWNRADGSLGGPDDYSTQAVAHVLRARGTTFRRQFGDFAAWNRIPALRYSEGRHYPTPPASASYRLGATHRTTGWLGLPLKHMSSVYLGFRPSRSGGARAHLRVQLDGPRNADGPEGRLLVFTSTGAVSVKRFALDGSGDGSLRVRFGRGHVRRVVLVMSNASSRFASCYSATQYSCHGIPVDDGRRYSFRARVS